MRRASLPLNPQLTRIQISETELMVLKHELAELISQFETKRRAKEIEIKRKEKEISDVKILADSFARISMY